MADHALATDAQAKADLIAQLDRSGIPQAIDHARQRDEVVSEFAGNPQAMASAILQLRASLALAMTPTPLTDPPPAKHTAGGWNRNIPPARRYPVIFAGRNKHVCRLITDGMTDEEVEANANLIAAAPDMLATMDELARAVAHCTPSPAAMHLASLEWQRIGRALTAARDVITKATGGAA